MAYGQVLNFHLFIKMLFKKTDKYLHIEEEKMLMKIRHSFNANYLIQTIYVPWVVTKMGIKQWS